MTITSAHRQALSDSFSTENATLWQHRISHIWWAAWPLLNLGNQGGLAPNEGYLSIGFSDFALKEPNFVESLKSSSNPVAYFEEVFQRAYSGWKPKARWSLWKFVNDMKVGDIVLVPGARDFWVCRIKEDARTFPSLLKSQENATLALRPDYLLSLRDDGVPCYPKSPQSSEKEQLDLGFVRKIEVLRLGIPRDFGSAALNSRMKFRGTTANISDLRKDLEAALKRSEPFILFKTLLSNTSGMIEQELDPTRFEKLIIQYLGRIGATDIQHHPRGERGTEGDADIIATFEPLKTIVYIQAKHHKGKTGGWAVDQILEYVNSLKEESEGEEESETDTYYTQALWVVSSAKDFNAEAKKRAQKKGVTLINGEDFAEMLLRAGLDV